jgi:MFS family permease
VKDRFLPRFKGKDLFSGLTRNIIALGIVSFLTDVSSEMIYPLLPIFLTTVLGSSLTFVGLIEGIAESTASLLKFFSGWLSDRWGKRKLLTLWGYSLSSLTRPLIALSTASWQVLLIRFTDRVGKGIRTSPRDALIADSVPLDCRGKAFGFHRSLDHLGAVVGPLLASLFLIQGASFRLVFFLAFIPAVTSVLVLAVLVKEKKGNDDPSLPITDHRSQGVNKKFVYFLVIIALFSLGNSSDAFLILRAKECGISLTLIPILWVFLHVIKTLSSFPGGIFSDRFGRGKVIIMGWLIYALVYLGMGRASTPQAIWLLFGIYGFYFGLTEGVEKALVADLVKGETRGTAYGIYNAVIGISALPASLLMGWLWQDFGAQVAFSFGGGLAMFAAVLLFILMRRPS